jgi:uncharacterized membrane protein YqjE
VNSLAHWTLAGLMALAIGLLIAGYRIKHRAIVRTRLIALGYLLVGAQCIGREILRYHKKLADNAAHAAELRALTPTPEMKAWTERLIASTEPAQLGYISIGVFATMVLIAGIGLIWPKAYMSPQQRLMADDQEAVANGRQGQTLSGTGTTA